MTGTPLETAGAALSRIESEVLELRTGGTTLWVARRRIEEALDVVSATMGRLTSLQAEITRDRLHNCAQVVDAVTAALEPEVREWGSLSVSRMRTIARAGA